jgi:hypothetical protein
MRAESLAPDGLAEIKFSRDYKPELLHEPRAQESAN